MSEKPKTIVLIIDDSKERQREVSDLISRDYFIMSAANCSEAKNCLKFDSKRISVIILSSSIRGEIPSEFVKFVKAHHLYNKIPVLIFCHESMDEEAKTCLLAGASDVFFENAESSLVLNRIKNVVSLTEAANILSEIEIDDLTGLYTRQAFLHHAKMWIDNAPFERNFGILAFDLENFKLTNSQYGEDKCNEFLAFVAHRLKSGAKDSLLGRFGGDQFVVLFECNPSQSVERLNKSISSITAQAPIPHQILKIGCYAPIDKSLPVVRCCDYAFLSIQQIKGVYGRNFASYEESLQQQLLNDQKILENMEKALLDEQFKVFYQPKHDTMTGKISGAEALVRWNHPVYGFMAPSQFIPLFEKSGFISKLDSFIVKKVCHDIVRWQENGIPVVPISVNVSRRDYFENGWLFEQLKVIDDCNIDHLLLHMEVTESLYAENTQLIIDKVKRVQSMGFLIEMDDFGAGYSSLGMLSTFPLDVIKLDISFVKNIETNHIVIESIVNMAHKMGLITIAEGVENEEQLKTLQGFGCDMIQGFYFSRPLGVEEYEKYLRKNACTLNKISAPFFDGGAASFDGVSLYEDIKARRFIREKAKFGNDSVFGSENGTCKFADLLPCAFFTFLYDDTTEILGFNHELLNIFDCDSAEDFRKITSGSFRGMVFQEDMNDVSKFFAENLDEKKFVLKYRIFSKTGKVKKVQSYIRVADTKEFGKVFYNLIVECSDK